MKKMFAFVAVLLVLTAFSITMFVHAGDMPVIPLTGASKPSESISEVSSDYEVPIDTTTAPLRISERTLKMTYKSTDYLTASAKVKWSSSDTDVVTVDESGNLTAVGRGEATITATTRDGRTATCEVTVRYTFVQVLILIFLFGWIWY